MMEDSGLWYLLQEISAYFLYNICLFLFSITMSKKGITLEKISRMPGCEISPSDGSEGDRSFFLPRPVNCHGQACTLDEGLDQGDQDHFAAQAVLVWITASATTRMARLTVKPRTKNPISVIAFPSFHLVLRKISLIYNAYCRKNVR